MLRVALTGGIACGQSTVARMLERLSCSVVEADDIAHRLLESGEAAAAEVTRAFGAEILDADGRIERRKLGHLAFLDPQKLARLNQITHPYVKQSVDGRLRELEQPDGPAVVIVAAALMIETGYYKNFDRLVVAWCRREQQRERLLARGLSPEEAERRIAAQSPVEEKRRLADDEVDCSGTLEETAQQVEQLAARLKHIAGASRKETF